MPSNMLEAATECEGRLPANAGELSLPTACLLAPLAGVRKRAKGTH